MILEFAVLGLNSKFFENREVNSLLIILHTIKTAIMSEMEVDEAIAEPTRRRIIPWVEKYRPSKVEEVSHQDEVLKTLKTSIDQGNLPHLLFHGPPGMNIYTHILSMIMF